MTAPKQPRAPRHTLPATDAEIFAWFVSMVEADQYPAVLALPPIYRDQQGTEIVYPARNQMAPLGRDYDHEKDADRWWWMRDHQLAVMKWLIDRDMLGHFLTGNPSAAEIVVRGQDLARNGGAK